MANWLYVALIVAGVFTALQVRKFLLGSAGRGSDGCRVCLPHSAQPQQDWPSTQPEDLLSGRAGLEGMKELAGEPGDISPPPSAVRESGFAWSSQGFDHQQARYRFPGSMDEAREHYAALLGQAGWSQVQASSAPAGGSIISFVRDGRAAHVLLRKGRPDRNMVVISVIVTVRGAN